jgi:hypothetical protein
MKSNEINYIYKRIHYYKKYLRYRCDIIANDPKRWLGVSKLELPSFDYYLKNCVEDKGGKYDFTVRRYSTPTQHLNPISFNSQNKYQMDSKILYRNITHSMWMATAFNYKTIIKTK